MRAAGARALARTGTAPRLDDRANLALCRLLAKRAGVGRTACGCRRRPRPRQGGRDRWARARARLGSRALRDSVAGRGPDHDDLRPDGRIARITLDRPERGNGITLELPRELAACVERANLDPEVHVIALAGNGSGFCGGYDLGSRAPGPGCGGQPRRRPGRLAAGPRGGRRQPRPRPQPGTRSPTSR